jgi:hypothetical protein
MLQKISRFLSLPRFTKERHIYIAFFSRSGHEDYHTAILVSPRNPEADGNRTWQLHVMNRINPTRRTQEEWEYEPLLVAGRPSRLLALVLLSKTELSGRELSEMLRAVEVIQDDTNWNCRTWTLSAAQASLTLP